MRVLLIEAKLGNDTIRKLRGVGCRVTAGGAR
jgi:hypothetical protein